MRIAVPTDGDNLDAEINNRFGRCRRFLLVDAADGAFTTLDNGRNLAGDSPGIQSAQMLIRQGIDAVITGSCGPNAVKLFDAAGISVVTGASGPIRDALAEFNRNLPHPDEDADADRDRQR